MPKILFTKDALECTVCLYSYFCRGKLMELVEVAARAEFIELLSKVALIENVTLREQQIALVLIGEWAGEISKEIKKPHIGGSVGSGFQ